MTLSWCHFIYKKKKVQRNLFPFSYPQRNRFFAADVTGEGWMGVGEVFGF